MLPATLTLLLLLPLGCKGDKEDTGTGPTNDRDGDGYEYTLDCDDGNPDIHPDATEVCNGIDDDCDSVPDEGMSGTWYADADGDGYGNAWVTSDDCFQPLSFVANAEDCNDTRTDVFPGSPEVCDGVDNNCDGTVDEGVRAVYHPDADGDGWGDLLTSQDACEAPEGWIEDGNDCDDALASVYPTASESCDGLDNDCDGTVDEETGAIAWADLDGDGYGDGAVTTDVCDPGPGWTDNALDCDDTSALALPTGTEVCDSLDNDCDGDTDENDAADASTWYRDGDGDSYGDTASSRVACRAPASFVADSADCDDSRATVYPGATEWCNDLDDDCDAETDESGSMGESTWYPDADGDGFGDPSTSLLACAPPSGWVGEATDCNDAAAAASPAGVEVCDDLDNDCDGETDEEGALEPRTWYGDGDGDGYGDPTDSLLACTSPSGYLADGSDCDDLDGTIHPGATELCDGYDNNCDTLVDETSSGTRSWYPDSDGDGWGDGSAPVDACVAPDGWIADNQDCNDGDPDISPSIIEVCDDVDNDCDGEVDEIGAFGSSTWYADADGDGYGTTSSTVAACTPPTGYVEDHLDCDDTRSTVHPGGTELCNGLDDDCDGDVEYTLTAPDYQWTLTLTRGFGADPTRWMPSLTDFPTSSAGTVSDAESPISAWYGYDSTLLGLSTWVLVDDTLLAGASTWTWTTSITGDDTVSMWVDGIYVAGRAGSTSEPSWGSIALSCGWHRVQVILYNGPEAATVTISPSAGASFVAVTSSP